EEPGRGAAALAQIAATTDGKERVEIPKIWNDLPVRSRYVTLAPWLLVAAAFLFLLEILERRSGWIAKLGGIRVPIQIKTRTPQPQAPSRGPMPKAFQPAATNPKAGNPVPAAAKTTETKRHPDESDEGSMLSALRQARDRAKRNQQPNKSRDQD
ncbi:MAG: hypothetical protein ACRED1_03640, partial [Limisphaerales bacterium]